MLFHMKPTTRTQIIETNWLEYLQWIKDTGEKLLDRPCERGFWKWYVKNKMKTSVRLRVTGDDLQLSEAGVQWTKPQ